MQEPLTLHIRYFARLREERGTNKETLTTSAQTPSELYSELQKKFNFQISSKLLKVAVNDDFVGWETPLKTGDQVVFIPPVAGG